MTDCDRKSFPAPGISKNFWFSHSYQQLLEATRHPPPPRCGQQDGRLPIALLQRRFSVRFSARKILHERLSGRPQRRTRNGFPNRIQRTLSSTIPARLLETCPPEERDYLDGLLSSMRHPRYKDPSRNQHWKLWNRFASRFGQDPYLSRIQGAAHHLERSLLFMAFALALRNGELDGKGPAKGSEITEALRYCGLCMVAYGYADPRRAAIGQRNLDHTIAHHLQRWRDADPAPKPQQALPNTAVAWIAQHYCASDSRMISASGHLIILAYFFLLRIGEYTKSSDQATRRTIPLRKGDVRLWSGTTELCRDAPLAVLLTADAVTICLANQKNGDKNSTLHHHSSTLALDPVKSISTVRCRTVD